MIKTVTAILITEDERDKLLEEMVSITMEQHYHCYILPVIKIIYSALQL